MMSQRSKRELLHTIRPRYLKANKVESIGYRGYGVHVSPVKRYRLPFGYVATQASERELALPFARQIVTRMEQNSHGLITR